MSTPTKNPSAEADASIAAVSPPAPAARIRNPVTFGLTFLGIGLAGGLLLGTVTIPTAFGMAGIFTDAMSPNPIASSIEGCAVEDNQWIAVGDDGESLTMDSRGEDTPGADFEDIFCVLEELNAPDSVTSLIQGTRALDGRQTAGWDGLSASWGYHPDDGLDIIVELVRE